MDPNLCFTSRPAWQELLHIGGSRHCWSGCNFTSEASAGCLRVERPEGLLGFHSGYEQACRKHPLCAGVSCGWIPASLFKLRAPHGWFSTTWTNKCENPREITAVFICVALLRGSWSPGYRANRLENYSGWPVSGNVLIYMSSPGRRCSQAVS